MSLFYDSGFYIQSAVYDSTGGWTLARRLSLSKCSFHRLTFVVWGDGPWPCCRPAGAPDLGSPLRCGCSEEPWVSPPGPPAPCTALPSSGTEMGRDRGDRQRFGQEGWKQILCDAARKSLPFQTRETLPFRQPGDVKQRRGADKQQLKHFSVYWRVNVNTRNLSAAYAWAGQIQRPAHSIKPKYSHFHRHNSNKLLISEFISCLSSKCHFSLLYTYNNQSCSYLWSLKIYIHIEREK